MMELLRQLRKKVAIGVVGGSDFVKVAEQLSTGGANRTWLFHVPDIYLLNGVFVPVIDEFDFAFAENGLTAYKLGKQLPSESFIRFLGEEKYRPLVNFMLHYIADLDIPLKRCVSLF